MGKKSSLLSHRGRSEAQVYDIHACCSILFTMHTGDWYLFLDIQFIVCFLTKRGDDLCWSPPDCTEVTRCDTRRRDVNSTRSCEYQRASLFFFSSLLPKSLFHDLINAPAVLSECLYVSSKRWKTNSGNLFLQMRYWSQLVCRASDIIPEKWMSNGSILFYFLFFSSHGASSLNGTRLPSCYCFSWYI